jgi:hypothetical protein
VEIKEKNETKIITERKYKRRNCRLEEKQIEAS